MKKFTLLLLMLLAVVGAKADTKRTIVYAENHTFGATYSSEVSIPAASFADLKSGDKLFLVGSGDVDLYRKTTWGKIVSLSLTPEGVEYALTDDEISNLKSSGMDVQATEDGVVIQQISYGDALSYGDASDVSRNTDGNIEATTISGFKVGDQLIFGFTYTGSDDQPFKFDLDNENWASLKTANWITYADKTDKTVTYVVTEAMLSELGSGLMRLRGENISYTSVKIKRASSNTNTYFIADGNTSIDLSVLLRAGNITLARSFDYYWNTLCLPFDCPVTAFSSGSKKFYTFKEYNSTDGLVFVERTPTKLSAGVPYLVNLSGTGQTSLTASNVTFNTTIIPTTAGDFTYTGNYTVGFGMEGKYGLAYVNEDGTKFRKGGSSATINAFRAYFSTVGSLSAHDLTISFEDEATGIKRLATDQEKNVIFNLMGVQMQKPQKGLNIINGKKVIIK